MQEVMCRTVTINGIRMKVPRGQKHVQGVYGTNVLIVGVPLMKYLLQISCSAQFTAAIFTWSCQSEMKNEQACSRLG